MGYDDSCKRTENGEHVWVNNSPGNGSDCTACGAATAVRH